LTTRLSLAFAALFSLALFARAEIVDRIAVSVGNQVITTSDINREIRVTSFQQRLPLDLSAVNRRATAERLVLQRLISRELENSRYPAPPDVDVGKKIAEVRKDFYPTAEEFSQALAKYGIAETDFKEELLRQLAMQMFIEIRFRPGVQVSDAEIEDYFHKSVESVARAAHPGKTPALEDYHDEIEEHLIGERVNQQLDAWLQQARKHIEVVYHEEALR
jgi:peptidyl-prolyl cis-trans isomerase SurA